jgi:hypothetical protein
MGATNVTYTASYAVAACPIGQYRAEYFGNVSLSGTPLFTRCETTVKPGKLVARPVPSGSSACLLREVCLSIGRVLISFRR